MLNDIKINGAKSELMVINSSLPREEQWIQMGTDNAKVFAKKPNEETRFLGVWLNMTMENKKSIARMHKTIDDFIQTTKCKKEEKITSFGSQPSIIT